MTYFGKGIFWAENWLHRRNEDADGDTTVCDTQQQQIHITQLSQIAAGSLGDASRLSRVDFEHLIDHIDEAVAIEPGLHD